MKKKIALIGVFAFISTVVIFIIIILNNTSKNKTILSTGLPLNLKPIKMKGIYGVPIQTIYKEDKQKLFIFFQTSCDHCQEEAQKLVKDSLFFKQLPIYMISRDDSLSIIQFMDTYGLDKLKNIQIIYDKDKVSLSYFKVYTFPTMGLYDYKGNLVYDHIGINGISSLKSYLN